MKVKLKSKCKTEIVRRKNLLHTEKLNIWLRKSLNKHSSTFLSLSPKLKWYKMNKGEPLLDY